MTERCETIVYVIAECLCGDPVGPCKIGIAGNAVARLETLQVASPRELKIAHLFRLPSREIARQIEKDFHRSHPGHRLRGEWFRIDPKLAALEISGQIRQLLRTADDWTIGERRAASSELIADACP